MYLSKGTYITVATFLLQITYVNNTNVSSRVCVEGGSCVAKCELVGVRVRRRVLAWG